MHDAAELPMTNDADWHPIETAPQDGTPVLLFHPAWDMLAVGVQHVGCAVWQQPDGDLLRTPTHWTTLPKPPELDATSPDLLGQDGDPNQ